MAALAGRIETVSADYGLPLRPGALVADLSVGERQRIEVVRCLLQEPRLLILDEPTAVLTPQEADQLFVTLERLAGEGCAVLYISHRLEEVKRLCHDATILRLGRLVARVDPQQESAASLARHMIGTDVAALQVGKRRGARRAPARARRPLHADRRPLRRCAEEHRSRGAVRRDRRDGGRRGQRPVGAFRRHLGRADEQVCGCGQAGGRALRPRDHHAEAPARCRLRAGRARRPRRHRGPAALGEPRSHPSCRRKGCRAATA